MEFIPVCTAEGIGRLAHIADDIWHEYWPDLIGTEQTDYMVAQFQSAEALQTAIHEQGYIYWLVKQDGSIVGYTGAHPEEDTGKLFISKVYLFATERGKGYASQIIRFYESFCSENGLTTLYLTVNKGNDLAIRAYQSKGFEHTRSVTTDIGEGFVMDDYIMEKKLYINREA